VAEAASSSATVAAAAGTGEALGTFLRAFLRARESSTSGRWTRLRRVGASTRDIRVKYIYVILK